MLRLDGPIFSFNFYAESLGLHENQNMWIQKNEK